MMSMRSFARAVPRTTALRSICTKATRPSPFLRPVTIVPRWTQPATKRYFSFSVRRQEGNEELAAKLESEINIEEEMRDSQQYSSNIKEYLENSPFELHDTEGQEEVVLTRKYNDEDIKITFTIADLANMNTEDADARTPGDEEPDEALYDDDGSSPSDIMGGRSGGANTKGAINQGRTRDGNVKVAPEDSISPADRPELESEEDVEGEGREASFPARASVRVERPGRGALTIEAVAQDGDFVIDNVFYFPTADLAEPKTAEKDYERRALYTGPPFGNLDEDLQILLEKYLEERGVNTSMALFIPDYIDFKEQKEYLRWLGNVKSFVE